MTAQPMQKQKMKVGHISGNTSSLIFDIVNTILLLMVCVITLYPFLNTVAISFNDSTDAVYGGIYLWPRVFSLRSYETILLQSSTIPHSALISALRAVIGTALSIPLSMMLAYVMSRRDFVLRSAVTKLVLFTMYVSGGLIPTFMVVKKLGLYDLTPAMCHLDYTMSEADGASNFVREYTLASGGPHCDCGYQKRS